MSAPLLTTKLNIPPLQPHLVKRPRLIAQLNYNLWHQEEFLRKLTLFSAPAGYGKTSLAIEWINTISQSQSFEAKSKIRTAWLSLGDSDNDPILFLAYIIAAIQRIEPTFGEGTNQLIQSPQPPPGEVILTTLLNEIAAIAQPFILVLDDYHSIQTPAIHQQLGIFIESQPSTMHLVLISREDPLLPIARLRAHSQLLEIRQEDLRFSYEECADFLQNAMGISLLTEHVAALERRTEGWIAGLQLAALSMQGHPDPADFIQAFTGSSRFVLDFLVEEVFNRQSRRIQEFLIKTSILDRLSGPLCDAITQSQDGQTLLETLEQTNLFIVPLDQSRSWYRYHRLFAELLRHRLRNSNRIKEADLHNSASRWFRQHDFIHEAFQHAVSAENWGLAAELVTNASTEMLKRGEVSTLMRWFGKFPQEVILANPRLCFDYCWPLLLTAQFETAAPLLDHVEKFAQEIPPFLGEVLAAQAFLARGQGDNARMVERSQRALKLLPKDSNNSRCLVSINLVLAYWHMGQMEATEQVLDEAIETSQAIGNTYSLMTAIIFKGRVFAVRGQLHQAAEFFQQAIVEGGKIPINALAHLDMATLHYEWNQLTESDQHLQAAIELCQRGQNNEFLVGSLMFLTRLRVAQGDFRGAHQVLTQAQDLIHTGEIPIGTAQRAVVTQTQLALTQEDLEGALQLADQLNDHVDCHPFYRFIGTTKARLLIAQQKFEDARIYLEQLYQTALQNGWTYAQIAIRVWQALAAETQDSAVEFIEDALEMAQPGGFIRTFVEGRERLIPVLQEASRRGITPDYVGRILTSMQAADLIDPDQTPLVEPLSDRELEVLRLIVAGLSNREIAQNLVVSLGTAKTHIHNIYGKLEVNNRAQAIARAREFELV